MRTRWMALPTLGLLAACQPEEARNIQAETDETMRKLENRADALTNEADKVIDKEADALDNQAAILANQADALRNEADNRAEGTANKQ